MKEPREPRIVSTRADDPELEESLERFVLKLAEQVDFLQDAQLEGDVVALARLGGELGREADELGFPALAAAAAELQRICEGGDAAKIHASVVALTDVARRVRMGYRGCFV